MQDERKGSRVIDVDISGIKAMESALVELAKEIGAKKATGIMTSALRDGAKTFEADMLTHVTISKDARYVRKRGGEKVQIRPGFLKSRIKIRASTSRGRITRKFGRDVVSVVKVGVFRVPYIVQYEYGTVHNKPNPIIRGSFARQSNNAVETITKRLAKRIELRRKRLARLQQRGS